VYVHRRCSNQKQPARIELANPAAFYGWLIALMAVVGKCPPNLFLRKQSMRDDSSDFDTLAQKF
jgi:hypothetical protein